MEKKNLIGSDVYCSILKEIESCNKCNQESIQKILQNKANKLISISNKVFQLSEEGILTNIETDCLLNNVYVQLVNIGDILSHNKR